MSEEVQKLRLREKIGYGFGDLASCLFWATIMSQLLFFYTDVFGLTGAAAGVMFFVSRILDALFDVVIGMTADRTKSRWGKFRPYILWGAVPLAVSAVLAFTTPEFGEAGKLVYAYLTFIIFMFLYSTVNIPYTALLGVISSDPVDRTSASSYKFVGAYLGGIIVSATILLFVAHFGQTPVTKFPYTEANIPYKLVQVIENKSAKDTITVEVYKNGNDRLARIVQSDSVKKQSTYYEATVVGNDVHIVQNTPSKGWQRTVGIYGIAAIVFFFITFISTRERIQPIKKEKTSIKDDLKDLSKNVPWMLLFAVTILFILFVCIRLSVTTHYFKYYVGEQASPLVAQIYNFLLNYIINPLYGIFGWEKFTLLDEAHKFGFEVLTSIFNTLGQGTSLIGVLMVPWFAKLLGRKNAVIVLFVAALFFTGAFYFFKPENLMLIFVFQIFGSVTGGPISALLWVLYADTADYSEWKTGRRATGLVFSASIMSNKIGWAVGSMIAAVILDRTGFVANVVQNVNVQDGLKAMMSIIPVSIGVVALILLAFFYKLNEQAMRKVKADLDSRRIESTEKS